MKTPYYSTYTREQKIRKERTTDAVKTMYNRTTEPVVQKKHSDWIFLIALLLVYLAFAFLFFFR